MVMSQSHQQVYRIFVGAFPTGEIGERIQGIRLRYDSKTARIAPPHVTLAGMYQRSGPATPENEAALIGRLKELEGSLRHFPLILGNVRVFTGANPVVYLGVGLTPEMLAARNALVEIMGPDKHGTFAPHLTLAMRLPAEKAQIMLRDLSATDWNSRQWISPVNELHLMQRGPRDPSWRYIATLKLS
jgi:2'-5' RNA ligase